MANLPKEGDILILTEPTGAISRQPPDVDIVLEKDVIVICLEDWSRLRYYALVEIDCKEYYIPNSIPFKHLPTGSPMNTPTYISPTYPIKSADQWAAITPGTILYDTLWRRELVVDHVYDRQYLDWTERMIRMIPAYNPNFEFVEFYFYPNRFALIGSP